MPTIKNTEAFYRHKRLIYPTIQEDIREDREIVYGARAINAQVPHYLRNPTTDYDIFAKHPLAEAKELESKLDRKFGFDAFRVARAQHPGTYRVKANVGGTVYADYTKQPARVPVKEVEGTRYATLAWHERRIHKTLSKESQSFRHEKDKATLARIRIAERAARK